MESISLLIDINKTYTTLKEDKVLLSYFGALDGDMIEMLVQFMDHKLSNAGTRIKIKKKVVNILIECLQNTLHYVCEFEGENFDEKIVESPFLVIQSQEEGINIYAGNIVKQTQTEVLKQRIDEIALFSEEELQEQYVKGLNKPEMPVKGGAGLGLIDIMRRAKRQVSFDFKELESDYWLFSQFVRIF
jgi:hypothetical protein